MIVKHGKVRVESAKLCKSGGRYGSLSVDT